MILHVGTASLRVNFSSCATLHLTKSIPALGAPVGKVQMGPKEILHQHGCQCIGSAAHESHEHFSVLHPIFALTNVCVVAVLMQGTERVPIASQGMPFDWHLQPALTTRTLSQRQASFRNGHSVETGFGGTVDGW